MGGRVGEVSAGNFPLRAYPRVVRCRAATAAKPLPPLSNERSDVGQRSRRMRRFHRSDSEGENVAKPKRPKGAPRITPCYMPLPRLIVKYSSETGC